MVSRASDPTSLFKMQEYVSRLSVDQLKNEIQNNTGSAPSWMLISALQDKLRANASGMQAQKPSSTVASDLIRRTSEPQQAGIGSLVPREEASEPQAMAHGGVVHMEYGGEVGGPRVNSSFVEPQIEEDLSSMPAWQRDAILAARARGQRIDAAFGRPSESLVTQSIISDRSRAQDYSVPKPPLYPDPEDEAAARYLSTSPVLHPEAIAAARRNLPAGASPEAFQRQQDLLSKITRDQQSIRSAEEQLTNPRQSAIPGSPLQDSSQPTSDVTSQQASSIANANVNLIPQQAYERGLPQATRYSDVYPDQPVTIGGVGASDINLGGAGATGPQSTGSIQAFGGAPGLRGLAGAGGSGRGVGGGAGGVGGAGGMGGPGGMAAGAPTNPLQEALQNMRSATEDMRKLYETAGKGPSTQERRQEAINMALLQAGLGMMQPGQSNALAAISRGAIPALQSLGEQFRYIRKEDKENIMDQLKIKNQEALNAFHQGTIGYHIYDTQVKENIARANQEARLAAAGAAAESRQAKFDAQETHRAWQRDSGERDRIERATARSGKEFFQFNSAAQRADAQIQNAQREIRNIENQTFDPTARKKLIDEQMSIIRRAEISGAEARAQAATRAINLNWAPDLETSR